VRLAGNAQGTTFSVIYEGDVDHPYRSEIDSILKAIDHSMSLWDDKSIINAFNASADSVKVDSLFKEVFLRSKYFYEISEGAFDPTVGPLMEVWGFARKNNLPMPDDTRVDSLKRFIGLSRCHLRGDYLVKDIEGIELDFNAIAQGYTADILARFLEQKGVKNYLVEIGGEVLAKGKNESGESWHVGIESPEFNSGDGMNPLQGVIALSGGALATSGNYRKYIIKDKKLFSHTIDPSTGKPVTHSLLSVSVIAPSAMDADAYATMFMVMGEEKALQMAENLGLKIQCISSVEGELSVSHSPGFQELIVIAD
jgi:thiamine biosynthesis lipoprotein